MEDKIMSIFAINSNTMSMNTLAAMNNVNGQLQNSLEKLSTGLKINSAADDPSGLAISETMRAQINGLTTAKTNAQEGVSMLQTAEGSLNTVSSILQQINTLAVRSANDVTLTAADRGSMDQEVQGLKAELDRISTNVSFNGKTLLDGTLSGNLQVGAGASADNQINVSVTACSSAVLGLTATDVLTSATALTAIGTTNAAINTVATNRGSIGTVEDRLQYTMNNLDTSITNTTSSQSNIRDTDMASEISNMTRLQILQQSDVAMLSQANSEPQAVLSLLKG